MIPLAASDRLPLTCTRLGTCCHGYRILLSPWELAWLAHGMGITPRVLRDTRTEDGGTRLRADGPLGVHGPPAHRTPACTLYDANTGCRAHAHRPLACRLYPLGRQRHEGAIRYYHPGALLPCRNLCPSVTELPERTVGDYLAEQDIRAGEAAHDGYAALAYGLINAALVIADAGQITRVALAEHLAQARTWSGAERRTRMGEDWYDLLTAPSLPVTADAAAFVTTHGRLLAEAINRAVMSSTANDALGQVARLDVLLGLHLGMTVGADPAVMAALISSPSTP